MLDLFRRAQPVLDAGELGRAVVALPVRTGCTPPSVCPVVIVDAGGHTRRAAPARRVELKDGEQAWAYHPGPYTVDLAPFAQAAEIGLRTSFAIDPEPGNARQRFDLLLAAEAQGPLHLAALARALDDALRRELDQGALALPPCTTIEEWNAFRQGLNQLFYMRFGLTVDDCVPLDLGETRDYAALLAARTAQAPGALDAADAARESSAADAIGALGASDACDASGASDAPAQRVEPALGAMPTRLGAPPQGAGATSPRARAQAGDEAPAVSDARALRRLFLELPNLMCGLRLAAAPIGQDLFRRQQALLQRLDLLCVAASSMPALELAAPGQPLAPGEQLRRARHSRRACLSLDEAWALVARFHNQDGQAGGDSLARLYDEAERIVANLETDCAARRATAAEGSAA